MRYAIVANDGQRCPVTFADKATADAIAEETTRAARANGMEWTHAAIEEEGAPDIPSGVKVKMVTRPDGEDGAIKTFIEFVREKPPGLRTTWGDAS